MLTLATVYGFRLLCMTNAMANLFMSSWPWIHACAIANSGSMKQEDIPSTCTYIF